MAMAAQAAVETTGGVVRTDKRQWGTAFKAMRKLLADPNDTVQVFRIMQALNAGISKKNYRKLLETPEGGRIAYERIELVEKLTDKDFVAQFAPGTVGAAYRAFLERTGYSADGLADVSRQDNPSPDQLHPHMWYGRRERDMHDIWHVMTGYQADEPLGELCLVAFSYAQTGGLGWGFIALMGALKNLCQQGGRAVVKAVWEGYRNGRKAKWLSGEDVLKLLAEPIDAARARLRLAEPVKYQAAQRITGGWGTPATA